jgi:hypothetical protein
MDAEIAAGNLTLGALLWACIRKPRKPSIRDRKRAAVAQFHYEPFRLTRDAEGAGF